MRSTPPRRRSTSRGGRARIARFAPSVHVITSKQRPRRLAMRGEDGREYGFLLGNKLHLLNHPPADNFIFFCQIEPHGLPTPDLFSNPIIDEAHYLCLGWFTLYLCSPERRHLPLKRSIHNYNIERIGSLFVDDKN